jgi:hypothetical protein
MSRHRQLSKSSKSQKDQLREDFLEGIERSWERHGSDLLEWLRTERTELYFRTLVRLTAVLHRRFPEPQGFDRKRYREDLLARLRN